MRTGVALFRSSTSNARSWTSEQLEGSAAMSDVAALIIGCRIDSCCA